MEVRVELASDGDFLDALVEEKFGELFANHVHADVDHRGGVLRGGLHAHLEVVDDREQVFEQALVRIADRLLAFAGGALAEIIHFGGGAEGKLLPFCRLGLKLLPRIQFHGWFGGGFRGFGRLRFVVLLGFVLLHMRYV